MRDLTAVTITLGILALGFLIVVHEAGHYFVARWCKMRVERFSIGFGPGILKRRNKAGTIFQLAPIPFGGFVEIRGMNIAEDVDPDDVHAYPNRPAWQRFITILAGPATNYLSAMVLTFLLVMCRGVEGDTQYIFEVVEGSPAAGQLRRDDRIVAIDGVAHYSPTTTVLSKAVNAKEGKPLTLTVERDGARVDVTITPRQSYRKGDEDCTPGTPDCKPVYVNSESKECTPPTEAKADAKADAKATDAKTDAKTDTKADAKDCKPHYVIGVRQTNDYVDVGILSSTRIAFEYPIEITGNILAGFRDIFTGKEKADVGGPVRIVGEFKKAFGSSWASGIKLVIVLSVYLGLFNLFPLPALDGGRLVFLGYEMVTRRRANPKIETMVHMGGIMVLMVIMLFVFVLDIRRLF